MDHTQLLHALQNNVPTEIWYLIPLFLVAAVIKSPCFKGRAGEAVVNLYAKLFLDKSRYHLIKNVTLDTVKRISRLSEQKLKNGCRMRAFLHIYVE
ncbi:hypothetical protein SAMN04488073_1322 [Marinobacter gudaonensis]|uniref:Uncharacterized protein n=1 Tax=Marinobacter gudaonensis TaxID=375760 RepID=A0A1I6GQ29_9GAMM|nr:hypothetical protein [Marinobacter gudaonensis]SFR44342.1 hypothetical protein SAMN04488073_1322 [Marinobacter gudaonensis]